MRARDTQRKKVYAAADIAFKSFGGKPVERVETMDEITKFVSLVWTNPKIESKYSVAVHGRFPTIGDGRGRVRASGGWDGIKIPRWCRFKWLIVHELAHTVTVRTYGNDHAWHGWEFCAVYLDIVRATFGAAAHEALKSSFKKHRVRFTEPRKRAPLDPACRAKLVSRLETHRNRNQLHQRAA